MYLPEDPVMLLSVINTKLRDEFASLDALASAAGASKSGLSAKLASIGYYYDSKQNQFK